MGEAIETRQRTADLAAKADNAERQRYWQREIVGADAGAGAQQATARASWPPARSWRSPRRCAMPSAPCASPRR
ncbi:MAG: hypothetical protein U1F30_07570 [Steroidobacteraceae bacterium]